MAQAPILYTGKGLAAEIPKDGGGLGRLSDFIAKAEEIKYKAFKENEQEFLKASNVAPKFFLSAANQKAQSILLDAFNKKWAANWKKSGYNMTSEEKMQMQAEHNFIIEKQNEMLAKQKMWEEEDELVKKNPAVFDEKEHALKTIDYMNKGDFDYTTLPYRAKPISSKLIQLRGKIGTVTQKTIPVKDTPGYQQSYNTQGTRDDIAPIIVHEVYNDPATMKDMMNGWKSLPLSVKNELLDTDKIGGVSEAERKAGEVVTMDKENPILKWYIDENYKYAIKEEPVGEISAIKEAPKGGSSVFKGFGGDKRYDPTEARSVPIGQTRYTTYHEIKGMPSQEATFNKGRVLDTEGETLLQPNTPITSRVIGYDEDKDEFIFIATKNFINLADQWAKSYGEGLRFSVKRSDLPDMYNDFDIIKDGKTVKVGSVSRTTPSIQPTTPKKKILVDGKWVYPEEATQK